MRGFTVDECGRPLSPPGVPHSRYRHVYVSRSRSTVRVLGSCGWVTSPLLGRRHDTGAIGKVLSLIRTPLIQDNSNSCCIWSLRASLSLDGIAAFDALERNVFSYKGVVVMLAVVLLIPDIPGPGSQRDSGSCAGHKLKFGSLVHSFDLFQDIYPPRPYVWTYLQHSPNIAWR